MGDMADDADDDDARIDAAGHGIDLPVSPGIYGAVPGSLDL